MASNSIQDWKATKIKLLEDQSQQIRDEIEAIERDYDARIDDVLVAIEDVEVADQQAVELSQAQMLKIEEAQKALSVKQRRIESYRFSRIQMRLPLGLL
ncbi:hypothetical protein EJ08DRAFT_82590 [Tothia fuscella]|uniref:Uncharacterized protein n=1 Tax=Tothia fuscella TaxID=1048955 RepID=A0A9P4NEM8_9PEZI|nr:hypothetical protein EJ08DRAFT_82590 [Tothia fuscella]